MLECSVGRTHKHSLLVKRAILEKALWWLLFRNELKIWKLRCIRQFYSMQSFMINLDVHIEIKLPNKATILPRK